MLYTDYYRRMSKVMLAVRAIKKHLLVILISIIAVLATIITLLATRGLVYDKVDCPAEIVYGQDLNYSAGAFLAGNISYEYRADGSSEWSKAKPVRAGKYYVRAVSTRTGGAPSYGNEHAFSIKPKTIDITVGNTVMFGENPGVTAELAYGDTIDCSEYVYADPSRNATTVNAVADSVVITDGNGEDVTACYDIKTPQCPIVFTPRSISITVADKTAEYDNTPVAFGGYEHTGGTLADGNIIVCVADTALTEVGTVNVTPSFRVLDGAGIDVTANYNITQNTGKITVTHRVVLVTAGSAESVYDGTPFSYPDYEITGNTSIVSGHKLSPVMSTQITDVGSCENLIGFKVLDGDGKEVTGNYSIVLTAGTLTVTQRSVTVKSVDRSWVYDGDEHSDVAVAGADGIVKGHQTVIASGAASITEVGETVNEITVTIEDAAGNDKTANYNISYEPGTLSVTKRSITVLSVDGSFVYNGKAYSKNEIESVSSLVDGHFAVVDTTDGAYATITDVGETPNKITVTVWDADGIEKTENYKIIYDPGKLKVKKRPITVKAGDDTHVYDDTEFSSNKFEIVSETKLVVGHSGVAECDGVIIDVGEENAVIKEFAVFDGDKDVSGNYDITLDATPAEISVTKRTITVKSDDGEFEYDGTEKSNNKIKEVFNIVEWHTAVEDTTDGAYATITDKGDTPNKITITVWNADRIEKTDNYNIEYECGTLTVTPRPITVKSTGDTKIYDGNPLVGGDTDFEIIKGSLVLEHTGSATCTGAQTDVGFCDNVITEFLVNDGSKDVTRNYNITISEEKGVLTVTKRPIKVTPDDANKTFVYNGEQHTYTDCTIAPAQPLGVDDDAIADRQTVNKLSNTQVCDVVRDGDGNVVGVANDMYIEIKDGNIDKTSNYDIVYEPGTVSVVPRPIKVMADSCSKIYDGTPLVADKYKIASDSPYDIVKDQTGKAVCSGTSTDVCAVETVINKFEVFNGDADVSDNYTITLDTTPATLEIFRRPIKVISGSKEFVYDGDEHYYIAEYDVKPDGALSPDDFAIVDGQTSEVVTFTKQSEVKRNADGKVIGYDNAITIKIVDASNVEKTGNYNINYAEKGELKINPRPIKVTTESKDFVYNDRDHDWQKYSVAPDGELNATDVAIVSGQQDYITDYTTVHDVMRDASGRVIGCDNGITIAIKRTADDEDKTYNYKITYVYGKLVVNPIELKYKSGSAEKYFDGTPLYGKDADIEGYPDKKGAVILNPNAGVIGHAAMLHIEKSIVKPGTVDNTVTLTVMKGEKDVTNNYNFTADAGNIGKLTVKKVKLTVTTPDDIKIYDGTPLINKNYEYKFVAGSDAVDLPEWFKLTVDVTGSQTTAGSSVNMATVSIAYDTDYSGDADVSTDCKGYVTDCYIIFNDFGTLTVSRRPIKITTGDKTWVYDDTEHDNKDDHTITPNSPEVTGGAIASGQHYTVNDDYAKITDVGSTPNKISITIFDADNNDVTTNYTIENDFGTLTVTLRHITVQTGHNTLTDDVNMWLYDGQPHEDSVFAEIDEICSCPDLLPDSCGLIAVHTLELKESFAVTDVNRDDENYIWDNELKVKVVGADGIDKSNNYSIHYSYGQLQINPRLLIVNTATRAWEYDKDKESYYDYGFNVSDSIVSPHVPEHVSDSLCEIRKSEIDVDKLPITIDNEFEIWIRDPNNNHADVTGNYDVNYNYGKLTVVEGKGDDDEGGGIGGGDISGGDEDGDGEEQNVPMMTIETTYKGQIYLRQRSYGDYNGKGFAKGEEYQYGFTYDGHGYSMNYMPTVMLNKNNAKSYKMKITLESSGFYVLPYFPSLGDTAQIQSSDVEYYWNGNSLSGDDLSYEVNYYPYTYTADGGIKLKGSLDSEYQHWEDSYYSFVKSRYLQIPATTREYFEGVITEQRFDKYDESKGAQADVIAAVARFIQNSATYNLKYKRALDDEPDKVVAFLTKYKEGICQHYSAAATMLLRTLGYPARYVTGAVATGDGTGDPITVMSKSAHAWVEVYIKGAGWVPVEVTGSGMGNGNGNGVQVPKLLTIKPADVYATENPTPRNVVIQTDGTFNLSSFLKKGFYYEVEVKNNGDGTSRIEWFALYNPQGICINDEFAGIKMLPGKLVATHKTNICVDLGYNSRVYDGKPFELAKTVGNDYYVVNKPSGYTVTLDLSGISITDAGYISSESLYDMLGTNWYTVKNAAGNNVTNNYFIVFTPDVTDEKDVNDMLKGKLDDRVLEVKGKKITFSSSSGTFKYTGTPYKYEVVRTGALVAGHKDVISDLILITDVGSIDCKFKVKIFDENDVDVTRNYDISYSIGKITVID